MNKDKKLNNFATKKYYSINLLDKKYIYGILHAKLN